ncbi:family 1 encapsulin nanocompartment shell protein [Pseudonocardia sp. CA-107938]|uniref:family 1 encapsulin nanocompartment shell protein n=1 Tax=Pseudonocardia sp. CA-107938 TaxID=3240021 RepID=UPI003D9168EF
MNHLMRDLAPLSAAAWEEIDTEARQRLTPQLGARAVVDWAGSGGGWKRSAANLGRTARLAGPPPGVSGDVRVQQRRVLPLAEVRVPFTVDRTELDGAERGALDLELDDLARAARLLAEIENRAVFHGWPEAGFHGILAGAPHGVAKLGADAADYPVTIARAVETLRIAGVEGPYALAADPETYTRIAESNEGGHLLVEHLTQILGGKVVFVPGMDGAAVLSQRGGDFVLDVGQDVAVGYSHHDADTVSLYLEESFAFRLVEPDAACALG